MKNLHSNVMYCQLDPWELPALFTKKANKSSSLRTPSGYWKEKEAEFIAIRSAESTPLSGSPSYQGARRTLEFYLKDDTRGGEGTKTPWLIHQYQLLHNKDAGSASFPRFTLLDKVVLCKVFKKDAAGHDSSDLRVVDKYFEVNKGAFSGGEQPSDIYMLDTYKCAFLGVPELQQDIRFQNVAASIESHNVWQHFTKIRTKDDPDEVYAACHRCDQLLKAHPKKHGTSQLERHRNSDKCRLCCSNPSTDSDREMLDLLRTVLDAPNKQQKMDEKLDCQEDITQLDSWDPKGGHWYVTRLTSSLNRQTQGGYWEEIKKEFTAIRKDQLQMQGCWKDIGKEMTLVQMDHQFQVQVPQYIGLRRTLQFHLHDGRKMDWIMLEYQQLDVIEPPALFLQGDMVIRKVVRYDKDAVTAIFSDFNEWLNGDDDSEEYYYKGEGENMGTTLFTDYKHGGVDRKCNRTAASNGKSEVWMHFTKVYTADRGMVYAVCHICDRGYNGLSKNGTSQLWRHNERCSRKHPGIGNVNNGANAAWEAEIWPLFLLFKNYGEIEH